MHPIIPITKIESIHIVAVTTQQLIVADPANEHIIPRLAFERIVALAADQRIRPRPTAQNIQTYAAIDRIDPGTGKQHVVATISLDGVAEIVVGCLEKVIALCTEEDARRLTHDGRCIPHRAIGKPELTHLSDRRGKEGLDHEPVGSAVDG